jgi:hypothetical protein
MDISGFDAFVSAVTSECGQARDAVAAELRRQGMRVAVQSDFEHRPAATTTLRKLHDTIRDCAEVHCIVGTRSGECPPPEAAAPFRHLLPPGIGEASYSQWEYFFALRYVPERLWLYLTTKSYQPDLSTPVGRDRPEMQRQFVEYMCDVRGQDFAPIGNVSDARAAVLAHHRQRGAALALPASDGKQQGRYAFPAFAATIGVILAGGQLAIQHSKSWFSDTTAAATRQAHATDDKPDILQIIEKHDATRKPTNVSLWNELQKKGVEPQEQFQFVMAAQILLTEGRFKEAKGYLTEAIRARYSTKDPHIVMGELYYRVYLFDAFDRGNCTVVMTPPDNVSAGDLRGYLGLEIHELTSDSSPAAYVRALTEAGSSATDNLQTTLYVLSFKTEQIAGPPEETRKLMGEMIAKLGKPSRLPVPSCRIDQRSKAILTTANDEFSIAKKGDKMMQPNEEVKVMSDEEFDSLYQRMFHLIYD